MSRGTSEEASTPANPAGRNGSSPIVPLHFIVRVTSKGDFTSAREFTNSYHSYIKWKDRPSRKLYWRLFIEGQLIGVFGLTSAYARPKAVMEYMKKHQLTFNQIGNNSLYCLHGHNDRNAGTRFLALCRRDAKQWWLQRYGDDLRAMQTFILPGENRTGTVYKADNWTRIGTTTGGTSLTTRTLYGPDRDAHPEAEIRTFSSGEVKYLLREYIITEPKFIYMRLL